MDSLKLRWQQDLHQTECVHVIIMLKDPHIKSVKYPDVNSVSQLLIMSNKQINGGI